MPALDMMYLKALLIFVGILAYLAVVVVSWIHLSLMKWPPSRWYFLFAILLWPVGVPWFHWLGRRYRRASARDAQ